MKGNEDDYNNCRHLGTSADHSAFENPAAIYLRMPTERQQCSLDNQSAAIHNYAGVQGFEVIARYSDAARRGLVLKNRQDLKQLLSDVISGTAQYKAILDFDVSHWGRFQEADEAALRFLVVCDEVSHFFSL